MAEEHVELPDLEKLEMRVIALEQVLGVLIARLGDTDFVRELIEITDRDSQSLPLGEKVRSEILREAYLSLLNIADTTIFVTHNDTNRN